MPRKKKELKPIKIVSLDTETIGLDGDIKRIAIYDGININFGYTFDDIEPILLEYAETSSVNIFIHNLEFDARKIKKLFEKGNINWNKTRQINGRYCTIWCKDYVLHDSYRLLPESLSSLSKSFDLEHGKLDLWEEVEKRYPGKYKNHIDFLSRCDKDNELYLEYLGYDVMSLYELIKKLQNLSGLDDEEIVNRVSTASISKYIFKHGYKGTPFITEGEEKTDYKIATSMPAWTSKKPIKDGDGKTNYLEIEKFIREAYFGGRTEVFIPKIKNVSRETLIINAYHYDVNSLYPSQMIDNFFPVGFPRKISGNYSTKMCFESWIKFREGLGFVKAHVYIPQQFVPPLPVHMGKLVFPCGHVIGTWTYIELEYAIKNCGVKVVEYFEAVHFKKTFKVFKNFIGLFSKIKSEAKKNGEKALEKFAKLIQNVGYGYFAMNRDDKDELKDISYLDEFKDTERYIYSDEELGFIKVKSIVISDSIQVQIGAYVTSYARLILLDFLIKQHEKGEIYYCDTDSIVCSEKIDEEYVDKINLGFWDLEGQLIDGIFLFPKVYSEKLLEDSSVKEEIKFKGVGKEAQRNLGFDFYKKLYEKLSNNSNEKVVVEKDRELLRSIGYSQKKKENLNKLERRDKIVNLANKQKRNIDYSKNTSQAWFFSSIEEFYSFDFSEPIKPYKIYGNIIDPCSNSPKEVKIE